jgi:malate/lactate dehydrogenase
LQQHCFSTAEALDIVQHRKTVCIAVHYLRPAVQSQPAVNISEKDARKLTERIQNAGTEVVEAKVQN